MKHPDASEACGDAEADAASEGASSRSPGAWAVVLEATADPPFEFHEVKQLVSRLDMWHTSGLYSMDRYAVQLHVVAAEHCDALTIAVASHDRAIESMGVAAPRMTRAEVMTLGELQQACGRTTAEAPMGRVYDLLIPTALYDATRTLFWSTTRAQIDAVLTRFVIAVGGTVNIGELSYFPGQVSVDLGLSPGDRMYATADAASVSGLMIEQSLPELIHDAERLLAMLRLADQPGVR